MTNVHRLKIVTVGDRAKLDANRVLRSAVNKLDNAIVIGWDRSGSLYFASTDGAPDTLWLIEQARKQLLDDDE